MQTQKKKKGKGPALTKVRKEFKYEAYERARQENHWTRSLARTALRFAIRGYRVLPLPPLQAGPPPAGWDDGRPAMTVKEVRAHWLANPEDNVGIAMGPAIDPSNADKVAFVTFSEDRAKNMKTFERGLVLPRVKGIVNGTDDCFHSTKFYNIQAIVKAAGGAALSWPSLPPRLRSNGPRQLALSKIEAIVNGAKKTGPVKWLGDVALRKTDTKPVLRKIEAIVNGAENAGSSWVVWVRMVGIVNDSGGEGFANIYAVPDSKQFADKKAMAPGIEVRSAGGFIVISPSVVTATKPRAPRAPRVRKGKESV